MGMNSNINPNMNMDFNMNSQSIPEVNPNVNNNMMNDQNMGMNNNPISEVNQVSESDTFFVPASEQTPKFEPREVSIPKPVEPTPIMNNVMSNNVPPMGPTEVINNQVQNTIPQVAVPTPEPMVSNTTIAPSAVVGQPVMPNSIPQVMESPLQQPTNMAQPMPNAVPNMTVPEAIPYTNIQTPQPVEPLNGMSNIQNVVPNSIPNVQNVNPTMQNNANNSFVQGGASFVMNGQAPNNQNNGNWNL